MTNLTRLSLVAAAALLFGCANEDPAKLLNSARDYLAKGDREAAIIQLKTALQADPRLGEARWLLGRSLLDAGQPQAGLIEFDKALEAGVAQERVLPSIARALNLLGQHRELIDRYGGLDLADPAAQADLKTAVAVAYGALGDREQASKSVHVALSVQPQHGQARLFKARLTADQGDVDAALAAVREVLQDQSGFAEGWLTLAELLFHGKRDVDGALQAFRKVAELEPANLAGHVGAMRLLLGKRDLEAARAQHERMAKAVPGHPQTRLFEGQLALIGGQPDQARDLADQLLKLSPDNPKVLQLAAAAAYARGEQALTQEHLVKALRASPGDVGSRRLLALSHLKQSQPAKALEALQPLLEAGQADAALHALVAQAHMMGGDLAAAEKHFAEAARLDPGDAKRKTALAISRLAQGQGTAQADLASIAADDSGTSADLPLIVSYLRQGEHAKALKALDALEAKLGGAKAYTLNLRAGVRLRQRDPAAARELLEQALKLEPGYFPAAALLASLDSADGQPERAQQRLEAVLAADPGNAEALVALATLKARQGAPADAVVALYRQAVKHEAASPGIRLALVNHHLARNETAAALAAAREGAAAAPDDPRMQAVLGRALMAARDHQQAVSTYQRMAQLQPGSAAVLLKLAEAHLAAGSGPEAMSTLRRARGVEPDHLGVQRLLAQRLNAEGRGDEALAIGLELQRTRPALELGYAMEGAVHAAAQRWPKAVGAYQRGLERAPLSTDLATRLHAAWMAAGEPAKAQAWQRRWQAEHPKDAAFAFYLGDQALLGKDLKAAEAHYRAVIALQPDNALAVNNVAWLMAVRGQAGALEMAERANRLLVNRPAILDTVALAHRKLGQLDKATEVLRQALALAPEDPSLRLNLAEVLLEKGDKSAAREELRQVLSHGSSFGRIDEARALMQRL